MYNELLERLAKHYLLSETLLHPSFSEEYLNDEGEIDFRYLCRKHDKKVTAMEAKKQIAHYFGRLKFNKQNAVNEVDYKTFMLHYKFGKFKDTRGWITYIFEKTGLVLTRRKLYEYILRSSTTDLIASGRNVMRPGNHHRGDGEEWLIQR